MEDHATFFILAMNTIMTDTLNARMMDFVFVNNVVSHLCDAFLGAGGEVWRGESKTTICPRVIRLEVKGHFLLPLATLTKVQAVNTDKPVGARDHLHHQGQLSIGQREEETERIQ